MEFGYKPFYDEGTEEQQLLNQWRTQKFLEGGA